VIRPVRLIVAGLVVAAVAVAVLGVSGGLRRAPAPAAGPPTAGVADTVDSGPWTAAVTGATAANAVGPYRPDGGDWLLVVAIQIAVPGPDGQGAENLDRIASLPDLPGLTAPTPRWVVLRRDVSELTELNPGLPEQVWYIFEVADSTSVPANVTVQLSGYLSRYSFVSRQVEWLDFGPRARVPVPVRNSR
jgi:hypothetical protein